MFMAFVRMLFSFFSLGAKKVKDIRRPKEPEVIYPVEI